MLCLYSLAVAFSVPSMSPTVQPRAAVSMAKGNDAVSFGELDGSEVRVGIIRARWHEGVIDNLVDGAKKALIETGVKEENIIISEVPGSFELPLATRLLAASGAVDAIIPMGVLVKGDTYHFEVIADTVARNCTRTLEEDKGARPPTLPTHARARTLMNVGIQTTIPVIFGVLTVNTDAQATERSTGSNNHGVQWGKAAVEMALLRKGVMGGKKRQFMGFGEVAEDPSAAIPVGDKKIGF